MNIRWLNIFMIAGLTAVNFLAAELGHSLSFATVNASPVWPPTGISIAALLILGFRVWPGVFLGTFFGALSTLTPSTAPLVPVTATALAVAGSGTIGYMAAAWLTKRFAGGRCALDQPKTIFRFVMLAGVLATTISSTLGVTAVWLGGFESTSHFGSTWFTWWLGDMVSAIVITPLLLAWSRVPEFKLKTRSIAEAAVLLLVLALVCQVVFGGWVPKQKVPLEFFVIPMLIWAAVRFGQRGATGGVFILSCLAIPGTVSGTGPFAAATPDTSLLMLQAFIGVMSIMACMLAADADQRRQAEAALADSEQRYRELFESNPQPLWVHDYDNLQFLAVNQAAIEHYGYSREEFLNMRLTDIRPPEEIPALLEAVEKARHPSPVHNQWRHRKKDGTIIDVEVTRQNLHYANRPAAIVLVTDITERKRAEKRAAAFLNLGERLGSARTKREAAHIIIETADALFHWDACLFDLRSPGQSIFTTVLAIDTVNGQRKELPMQSGDPGPLSRQAIEHGPQLILREPTGTFPQGSVPFGDQTRPSASLMIVPVRKQDEVVGILSLQSYTPKAYSEDDLQTLQALADHCSGALDRIRAEEEIDRLNGELRKHLEELQILLEVAPVGIAVGEDPECRVIRTNRAAAALFGVEPGANMSKTGPDAHKLPYRIMQGGDEVPLAELPMQKATRNAVSITAQEFDVVFKDGRVVNCFGYASPLFDEAGKVRGCLGIFIDVTERKHAEQEILRLNAELERRVRERTIQLEAINKELEAFSYSVSHDLRAPLRSIRGFSEVLLERYSSQLDPRGQEFLRRACESCAHMDRLIEDLLKLSRVGRSELLKRPVDLSGLAESIAAELQKSEPERKVEFSIAPNLRAEADERLLRLALDNLLRNAWKFTRNQPQARIEFGLTDEPEPAFFVRDNGAGFDMTYAGKLFGVFQRLHTASEFPGTGIGLATVQRIIIRHGGRTWAKGAVQEGATFYFTLPNHASS